jgi:hypothetical protein
VGLVDQQLQRDTLESSWYGRIPDQGVAPAGGTAGGEGDAEYRRAACEAEQLQRREYDLWRNSADRRHIPPAREGSRFAPCVVTSR